MDFEIDPDENTITVELSEGDARKVREEITDLLAQREDAECFPTLPMLRVALMRGDAELNKPTECCNRILRAPHPGCLCSLEKSLSIAWGRVAEAAALYRERPVHAHGLVVTQRTEYAVELTAMVEKRRGEIAAYERKSPA